MKSIEKKEFLFKRSNFKIFSISIIDTLLISVVGSISIIIIATGFVLMIGGESTDPNFFNEEIFNFQRITLAPILVILGFGIAIISIFKKP